MKRKFSKILGIGLTLALLCSLLLTASPVMAATAITGLTVSVSDLTISTDADYTITFDATTTVLKASGYITVAFPLGTIVPLGTGTDLWALGDVKVQSTAGFGAANAETSMATADLTTTAPTATVGPIVKIELTALPTGDIGEAAMVRVKFLNTVVTNPAAIDIYTMTVKTSADTAAVPVTYTTKAPTVTTPAGVVEVRNPSGILMSSKTGDDAINLAIAAAGAKYTLNVGPGRYPNAIAATTHTDLNIIGTAGADDTIIANTMAISTADVTITGINFQGTVTVSADDAVIQNCIFDKAVTLLAIGSTDTTVDDCTLAITGTTTTTGITVGGTGATIKDSTFTVDAGGTAITNASGDATYPTTVSGNTITGSSGDGIVITAGVANIKTNTLSTLSTAIDVDGATPDVTVDGNTITGCGTAGTIPTPAVEIDVTGAGEVTIKNNTITGSLDDLLWIEDGADITYVLFNDLSGNAKGIDNDDTGVSVDATHNWWGAATGPASGFNSADVDASGYLGADATGVFTTASGTLTAKTTASVDVAVTGGVGTAAIIGAANYAANPQDATPDPALAGGYYDVFVDTPVAGITEFTIKFYNTAITADTEAWVWSTLQGAWARASSQGTNTFGGYVWVKVTGTTTPEITDLAGTPFALVEPPAVAGALAAPDLTVPVSGDDTVSLTPTFAWGAVPGADGYYFEFADNANFVVPLVKLEGDLGRLIVTAYAYVGELPYSTAYYWRVKAVSGTEAAGTLAESGWASAVFITMDEPVEPTPPVEIVEAPELPDITIEQPDITIQAPDVILPAETPITPAWIYVIIGVGAVLVIALLVLIVRTRRVA